MLITIPKPKGKFEENDLIAITKDNNFVGYMEVRVILENSVLVDADKRIVQTFNLIEGEDIPYSFEIEDMVMIGG